MRKYGGNNAKIKPLTPTMTMLISESTSIAHRITRIIRTRRGDVLVIRVRLVVILSLPAHRTIAKSLAKMAG